MRLTRHREGCVAVEARHVAFVRLFTVLNPSILPRVKLVAIREELPSLVQVR